MTELHDTAAPRWQAIDRSRWSLVRCS